jgi:ribonucleoside-diphosphate reductase alpha chain
MTAAPADADRLAVLEAQVAGPGETDFAQIADRVARAVAEAELASVRTEWTERFAGMIRTCRFLPAVPTLSNAGRGGQLAACFALEIEDTLESIYGSLHRAARIQQGSGGVGVELSALRPRGTPIERSGGHTPGPVAFAELFARSAHVMARAGRRAGAHLAILRDDHPDIVEFVRAVRETPDRFPQLGLAVGISDRLLRAAKAGDPWVLQHPLGATRRIAAASLLREIAESILATGNPTLLFLDAIEADNPTPSLGRIRATNPCGEQPLLANESCVLGSIHLPAFLGEDGTLDEPALADTVAAAIRFLDDAITVNVWPDAEIAGAAERTRKVGLGVMGLADWLLLRGLPYDGAEARVAVGRLFGQIAAAAEGATRELGRERGAFPACVEADPRRNATTRAVAPTGTLHLLAGCSPGIETFQTPRIHLETDRGELTWTDRWLRAWLAERLPHPDRVLDALDAERAVDDCLDLADADRALLHASWRISPEAQIEMQATVQRWVDGAVSKTVHLTADEKTNPDAIVAWTQQARALGCKGVAFYERPRGSAPMHIDLCMACDSTPID